MDIEVYVDSNKSGTCGFLTFSGPEVDTCGHLSLFWNDKISSVDILLDGLSCYFYAYAVCV